VIVVANGGSDDTGVTVRACTTDYSLRLIEIPEPGIARARNRGAAIARGAVLVFLDDDFDPLPGLIEAHARAHELTQNIVALGRLLPAPEAPKNLFAQRLRDLNRDHSAWLAEATERLNWRFVVGSNISLSKSFFEQIGGYDDSIVAHGSEDYEFGYRAQCAGARFVFLPDANGYDHRDENTSIASYLLKARSAGRNDTGVLRRHPDIAHGIRLGLAMSPSTTIGRLGRSLAFDHPRFGDAIAGGLLLVCGVLARARMRRRWNRLMDHLWQYWYFRGVTDALGNSRAIAAYFAQLQQATRRGTTGS